jgi:hypothetical protein
MRAKEFITEAVGGNYLYHGVQQGSTVMSILRSGTIKPMQPFDFDAENPNDPRAKDPVVSLSRSQYLRHPFGTAVAQFVIDADALRRVGNKPTPMAGQMVDYKTETEERVYKPIPIKAPFVVAVQFDPAVVEEIPKLFFKKLKDAGVKVEAWKSYKETPNPDLQSSGPVTPGADRGKPFDDWTKFHLVDTIPGLFTLFYKKPGFTYGDPIRPFEQMQDKNFAEKILKLAQQRTKQGQGINDIISMFDRDQFAKSWKKGVERLNPSDPRFAKPEIPNN